MASWQSSVARSSLRQIIDQAVDGHPQFIQRRDGKEVVVVSREYFERTKPNLKTVLLNEGYEAPGEQEFDAIMADIRSSTAAAFTPRLATEES
jgi:PHD/YefM family antitoxin component YafN of YafNO toxin-antitoxin module